MLDALLGVPFPGVGELRIQARSVHAVARHRPGFSRYQVDMVLFEVLNSEVPRARVHMSQPVAAEVRGRSESAVLLTVRDGFLAGLEVVEFSGELPSELPPVNELGAPFANYAVELG